MNPTDLGLMKFTWLCLKWSVVLWTILLTPVYAVMGIIQALFYSSIIQGKLPETYPMLYSNVTQCWLMFVSSTFTLGIVAFVRRKYFAEVQPDVSKTTE